MGERVVVPRRGGSSKLRVLAVEDSAADARLLKESVSDAAGDGEVQLVFVDRLADAEAAVRTGDYDCVLLDLGLPDATGMDNVQRLKAANRWQTIVIMTGLDSEDAALGNLQRGAQDYIVKGSTGGAELIRVIRRAIERNRVLSEVDRMREEQYQQATHDALTGLPNRQLFMERARRQVTQAERHGQTFAIGYLDLDGFKAVNDHHGHAVGDAVLRAVGQAAREAMRETDTVARVGGDEFQFLLAPIVESDQAQRAMARVSERVAAIREVDGREVRIGASIGLAFYPRDSRSLDELISMADQAMYAEKRAGRDSESAPRDEAQPRASAPNR